MDRVIGVYDNDLDKLMKDYILHESLVNVWQKKNEEYILTLRIEIDEKSLYTLLLECKKK